MLPEVVNEARRRYGHSTAYATAEGWDISYADLDRLSDEAAVGLAGRFRVHPGSVVALAFPSTIDYVIAYLAVAKLGAVTAGVNPRLTAPERAAVVEATQPDLVLASPELAEGLTGSVIGVDLARSADDLLGSIRAGHHGEAPATLPDDPERGVAICFTSGSTGQPKGALFANRQFRAIAELDTGGAWGGGGHLISSTQFAHIGFMTKVQWILAGGNTTHVRPRWSARETNQLIAAHRMPSVNAVPPQLALMLRDPAFDSYDFSAVKAIVCGAAASPPALVAEARERFRAPYSIRYSSTESGGVGLATALDADDEEALYTVGRPRPGVEARVALADGSPVADGEVGELWLRSPAVMSGYWRLPEDTAAAIVDGWLRTGDLAQIDDRGLVRLAGRVKEMYIRGGYNVYPLEVEAVLGTHPLVAEVAVVPRADDVMGEIGVAVVVPRQPAHRPTLEDLRSHGATRLAHYKLPEAIRFVDTLPLNATSKIDRRALAELDRTAP